MGRYFQDDIVVRVSELASLRASTGKEFWSTKKPTHVRAGGGIRVEKKRGRGRQVCYILPPHTNQRGTKINEARRSTRHEDQGMACSYDGTIGNRGGSRIR